jgi:hypothetical protein
MLGDHGCLRAVRLPPFTAAAREARLTLTCQISPGILQDLATRPVNEASKHCRELAGCAARSSGQRRPELYDGNVQRVDRAHERVHQDAPLTRVALQPLVSAGASWDGALPLASSTG